MGTPASDDHGPGHGPGDSNFESQAASELATASEKLKVPQAASGVCLTLAVVRMYRNFLNHPEP